MEGRSQGLVKVLSQHFLGGADENHETQTQANWWPSRDLNKASHESRALLLHQQTQLKDNPLLPKLNKIHDDVITVVQRNIQGTFTAIYIYNVYRIIHPWQGSKGQMVWMCWQSLSVKRNKQNLRLNQTFSHSTLPRPTFHLIPGSSSPLLSSVSCVSSQE